MQSDNEDLLCPFVGVGSRLRNSVYFGGLFYFMIKHNSSILSLFRKGCIPILAFSLFAGLFLGSWLQQKTGSAYISLMHISNFQNVSIVSQISVLLLPFLLSALICSTRSAWMILPLSFFKGISFGFSQSVICASFAGAGWLIYFFLMFSSIISLPVLIFFWFRCLSSSRHIVSQLIICLSVVFMIIMIDRYWINPYWVSFFI